MSDEKRCAQCGAELAVDAPYGLCPACLLKRGLETQSIASEGGSQSGSAGHQPPSPAELAPYFPELEILELIGKGGMGVVYKARQKRLDRLVALKILSPQFEQDPAFAERFHREARAMGMLNHPHIVAVHDFGQTSIPPAATQSSAGSDGASLYYFLMEFVDGVNLRRLLETGKLASEQALAIVPQLCDALQYAHNAGVVHRDIKPENILLDKSGRVKIADFGLAKLTGQTQDHMLTGAGQVMGTPHYMAPEQLEHPQAVDHRADIYSLGVVFYQMLTGELPIGRFAPPSRKVQVDVRLDEVVLHALEKEPELRYQQASAIKTDVQTITSTPGAASSSGADAGFDAARPGSGAVARSGGVYGPQPRFSRLAIVGAAWAPLFFIMVVLGTMSFQVEVNATGGPPERAWWQWLLMFTALPLGLLAPFGTTILGSIALAQIRHSAGRVYGLGLALGDVLLFPLVIVDAVIWYLIAVLMRDYLMREAAKRLLWAADILPLVIAFAVIVAVDWFLVIAAWRALNNPTSTTSTFPAASNTAGQH